MNATLLPPFHLAFIWFGKIPGDASSSRRRRAAHGEPDPSWPRQGGIRGRRRPDRRRRALDGRRARLRRNRARRDAARAEWIRDVPTPADERRLGAGPADDG